jgi:hypothetical protein
VLLLKTVIAAAAVSIAETNIVFVIVAQSNLLEGAP